MSVNSHAALDGDRPALGLFVSVLLLAICCTAWCLFPSASLAQNKSLPEITLGADNVRVDRSVRIKRGRYVVADADLNGVIHVTGDDVVLDFQGAVLQGLPDPSAGDKEKYAGFGVVVEGRKNIVIKNAKIQGYQHNIRAQECAGLKVESCDTSHSRGQRISQQGQPVNLWLELRDIEAWRNYGAGMWLEKCQGANVAQCRSTGSQNGVILAFCEGCTIHDNDVAVNSGWGVGLWSSVGNIVSWNHADFCNRPWGGNDWGCDSAGIALASESHRNYIVGNSLTYGGDGFFLTDGANMGQRTSNENLIAYNDGSWSFNNAFESTFSGRNVFWRNIASDSRYGFWLGYSQDNIVAENRIERNALDGVAIECGQRNRIFGNKLADNRRIAIHLWKADPTVESRDSVVIDNEIRDSPLAFNLEGSTGTVLVGNKLQRAPPGDGKPGREADRSEWRLEIFLASDEAKRIGEIMKTKPRGFKMFTEQPIRHGFHLLQLDGFTLRDIRGVAR